MEDVNILFVIAPFGMVDVVHGTERHGVGAGSTDTSSSLVASAISQGRGPLLFNPRPHNNDSFTILLLLCKSLKTRSSHPYRSDSRVPEFLSSPPAFFPSSVLLRSISSPLPLNLCCGSVTLPPLIHSSTREDFSQHRDCPSLCTRWRKQDYVDFYLMLLPTDHAD
jgi:hypothetical protein